MTGIDIAGILIIVAYILALVTLIVLISYAAVKTRWYNREMRKIEEEMERRLEEWREQMRDLGR